MHGLDKLFKTPKKLDFFLFHLEVSFIFISDDIWRTSFTILPGIAKIM